MLRHTTPRFASALPLVLLGSLPLDGFAGELFFPVLEQSGSHWFSWFDPAYLERTIQTEEHRPAVPALRAAGHQPEDLELRLEQDLPWRDAYDQSRIEVLGQLASHYREQGRYADAFDRLERQYFLTRVTLGLHDARQVPLLQELVELAQLKGDIQRSQELRHALLYLQLRVFDESDVRHTEALLSWADWHLQCFLADSRDTLQAASPATDPRFNPHFVESDEYFMRALRKLSGNMATAADQHISLLVAMRKWQTLHLSAFRRQLLQPGFRQQDMLAAGQAPDLAFAPLPHPGRFMHLLRPSRDSATTPEGQELELHVIQLLQIADWQQTLALHGASRRTYDEAINLLRAGNLPAARSNELLTPGLPVPDPEHWYHFHRQPAVLRGYLDVEITLDEQGRAENAVLLDPAARDTRLGQALLQQIAGSSFRPALGAERRKQIYRLRYYHQ